ncbi:MAG: patatin-like phospholipase family protein, partial [Atribacterota bacterium]|nr:patatin-like phospholipase family protein [Atribacterota bacterium]
KKGLKFGLALGSGSARGMAHIGVIQVLEAYHIPVNMIAGTSIGSVVGSVYATGASVEKMKEAALSMKRSKTISLMDPTLPFSGLLSGNRVEEILNKIALKDKTFDDLKIPFAAVATDIETGAKVILNQGSVIRAVRASISIPGIFTPVKYQDYYLVDGGVVDPVPVDVVQKMGADIIIAVSLAKISPYTTVLIINKETGGLEEVEKSSILQQKITQVKSAFEGPNIIEVISQSIDIMEARITDQCLEGADVVIVPFGIKDINLFDFDKAELLIKGGIMATMINIPEIKRAIKEKLQE